MGKLDQTIENVYQKIPFKVIRLIRIFALILWAVLGLGAAFYAWNYGVTTTPGKGQDLYLSEIKEKMEREQNRENRDHVVIPDTDDLVIENDRFTQSMDRKIRSGLAPEDSLAGENEKEGLPPFLGEKRDLLYPESTVPTGRDEGVAGVRESTRGLDESIPLLPPESVQIQTEENSKNRLSDQDQKEMEKTPGPGSMKNQTDPGLLPVE